MSTIDNIAAKLTKVEIQYLINNPDKLANVWNDLQVPKKQLECEIGDCFIEPKKNIFTLYKITNCDDNNVEYDAIVINNIHDNIRQYNHYISRELVLERFKPIDKEIFNQVKKICDDLETQIKYMHKGAVVIIKELCQEVNQNQEKE